jgi:hypothetical protein
MFGKAILDERATELPAGLGGLSVLDGGSYCANSAMPMENTQIFSLDGRSRSHSEAGRMGSLMGRWMYRGLAQSRAW